MAWIKRSGWILCTGSYRPGCLPSACTVDPAPKPTHLQPNPTHPRTNTWHAAVPPPGTHTPHTPTPACPCPPPPLPMQVDEKSGAIHPDRWSVQYTGTATFVQVKGLRPGRRYAARVLVQPTVTNLLEVVVVPPPPSDVVAVETLPCAPMGQPAPQLASRAKKELKVGCSEGLPGLYVAASSCKRWLHASVELEACWPGGRDAALSSAAAHGQCFSASQRGWQAGRMPWPVPLLSHVPGAGVANLLAHPPACSSSGTNQRRRAGGRWSTRLR